MLVPTYLFASAISTVIVDDGGPGWLNLLVLLLSWNAIKFVWLAVLSPFLTITALRQRLVA